MTRIFNPPHPGATLREDVLPAMGLTVSKAAELLGVTRVALLGVVNEYAAISAEMALRIERWLGVANGGDAAVWLNTQAAYDLWKAEQALKAASAGAAFRSPKTAARKVSKVARAMERA